MSRVFLNYGVLLLLLFQFTSCLKDKDYRDPIYFFYDEPVVVEQLGAYPIVRNQFNSFYAPGLADNSALKEGDLLWSSFIVDLGNKDIPSNLSTIKYTAQNIKYEIVECSNLIVTANSDEFELILSNDFSYPIESSVLFRYAIDSIWFMGFKHYQNNSNQLHYTYELVLNPVIEQNSYNSPTFYIRAKQVNSPGPNKAKDENGRNVFAFDVSDFVKYYKEEISPTGLLRFNLKYKTGVDNEGKDIYKEFLSNPISWNFNSAKPK